MRRLILFRHAKAEARAPGGEDIDRGLTERGRRDAALIGEALARSNFRPDLALVSPSARTRETWLCAQAAFGPVETQVRDGLYNATPEEVADEIAQSAAAAGTVLVVGHNPSLQELSVNLLAEGAAAADEVEQVAAGFPTAAAAVFHIGEAGRACLEALLHARDLGGGEEQAP